jgi:cytosine permease
MRRLTAILGAVGIVLAVAGIWSHFEQWLNLLGVIVPPIGTVLILDQLVLAHFAPTVPGTDAGPAQIRWASFVAWAAGSTAALLAHSFASWLSDAVIGILTAAAVYIGIRALTQRQALPQARQASGSRR